MIRKAAAFLLVLTLAVAAQSQASQWEFDTAHTGIEFKVKHLAITNVRGSFETFSGMVNYDEKDITQSSIQVTIDAASINTLNDQRDNHLRSPDFFDVKQYPQLTFVSKQIEKTGAGLKITGDLTIHGVTKEVILNVEGPTPPIKSPMGDIRMGATATAGINRTDFGLTWNKIMETGGLLVGENVAITIEAELVRK